MNRRVTGRCARCGVDRITYGPHHVGDTVYMTPCRGSGEADDLECSGQVYEVIRVRGTARK